MAFPTHNTLQSALTISLPDDLHYNYAYSVESSSPYSPDFPSTPSVYDDGYASQPLPDVYQNADGGYSVHASVDAYHNGSNLNEPPLCSPAVAFPSGLPLYAPTPLPVQSPLLRSDPRGFNYPFIRPPQSPRRSPVDSLSPAAPVAVCDISQNPVNTAHCYEDPAQITFPTPSELLVELSGRNPGTDQLRVEKKSETRKARRRAVAKSVGFVPTDPDTISSHDKKRHYLECLEHYVMYLHEQLQLVGAEPVNLERVSNYRGLNSRSIRTLLVHMENTNRKLNLRTLDEEQRFMILRDAVCRQDAAASHQSTSSDASCVAEVSTNWQW